MSMEHIRRDMEKLGVLADKNKCAVAGCARGGVAGYAPPDDGGYTRLCAAHAEAARKLSKKVDA